MLTTNERRAIQLRAMLDNGDAQRLIKSAGLSYRQVGHAIGCDGSAVWRWHHGERRPNQGHALKYLRLLEQVFEVQCGATT